MSQVEPPQIVEEDQQIVEPVFDEDTIRFDKLLEEYPDLKGTETEGILTLGQQNDEALLSTQALLDRHRKLNFQEAYKVTCKGSKFKIRGRCLIISNRTFKNKAMHTERIGTDVDRDNLRNLFESLEYAVTVSNNRSASDILADCSMFILDQEFEHFDSCVLCILSHGYKDSIVGSDSKAVKEKAIFALFKDPMCKLKGKPKLVIIQACRTTGKGFPLLCFGGNSTDTKGEGPAPGAMEEIIERLQQLNCSDQLNLSQDATLNHLDILVAHSTMPGALSWRNEDEGSWFIQAIVQVFDKKCTSEHVADMMVMVRNAVSQAFNSLQVPNSDNRLCKKFYFFPRC